MPLSISTETLWIDTPQGRLFCCRWFPEGSLEQTSKPPIILFHDSLGCIELWRDFPRQLSQATGREVIAYDRLGFGQSDAYPGLLPLHFIGDEAGYFVAYLKSELQVEDFVALGHSVGGAMAAACASLYPGSCKGLITIAAQAFVEDRTLQGISAARDNFAQPVQLERLARYHGDKAAWVLSAWVDTWLSPPFAHYRLDAALKQVHCPVLAIHGELDEFGSLVHPENICTWAQGPCEAEIIAGGGHVPHRELPERISSRIAAFLSKIA